MPKFEVSRREVNLSLLATAFACVGGGRVAVLAVRRHLFDFAIAGTDHYDLKFGLSSLAIGDQIELVREALNPFDGNAIAVHGVDGLKFGYIPRVANEPIAQMLDSGMSILAQISSFAEIDSFDDIPDDLVFTHVASGDPIVTLTLLERNEKA